MKRSIILASLVALGSAPLLSAQTGLTIYQDGRVLMRRVRKGRHVQGSVDQLVDVTVVWRLIQVADRQRTLVRIAAHLVGKCQHDQCSVPRISSVP